MSTYAAIFVPPHEVQFIYFFCCLCFWCYMYENHCLIQGQKKDLYLYFLRVVAIKLIVLSLILRSLIYFELIFIYSDMSQSSYDDSTR